MASETETVYHDENVSPVGDNNYNLQPCIGVKDKIPIEVAVNTNSNDTVEQLCQSEEVKGLPNLMKESLTKLDKE